LTTQHELQEGSSKGAAEGDSSGCGDNDQSPCFHGSCCKLMCQSQHMHTHWCTWACQPSDLLCGAGCAAACTPILVVSTCPLLCPLLHSLRHNHPNVQLR
jgi:hypothetical protein